MVWNVFCVLGIVRGGSSREGRVEYFVLFRGEGLLGSEFV